MQLSSLKPFVASTSMRPLLDCIVGGSGGLGGNRLLSSNMVSSEGSAVFWDWEKDDITSSMSSDREDMQKWSC